VFDFSVTTGRANTSNLQIVTRILRRKTLNHEAERNLAWQEQGSRRDVSMNRALTILVFSFFAACGVQAQSDVPILSGALAFQGSSNGGAQAYQPVIAPVLVAPFGDHWVVEARADVQGFISRHIRGVSRLPATGLHREFPPYRDRGTFSHTFQHL
jgi:hypothetical protein